LVAALRHSDLNDYSTYNYIYVYKTADSYDFPENHHQTKGTPEIILALIATTLGDTETAARGRGTGLSAASVVLRFSANRLLMGNQFLRVWKLTTDDAVMRSWTT